MIRNHKQETDEDVEGIIILSIDILSVKIIVSMWWKFISRNFLRYYATVMHNIQ